MFHPAVIAARREILERQFANELPPGGLRAYSVEDCRAMRTRLEAARDDKGRMIRALTAEEQGFIQNEWMLSKIDFRYWSERYCTINIEGSAIAPLYPLWESQRLIIERIADVEYAHWKNDDPDGVLVNILKSRQLGASTLAEAILVHRTVTHSNIFALIASDVPESSAFVFDMFERAVTNLPWYMQPDIKEHVKNTEMLFATNDSHVWVGSGKSTRGTEGKRGQLGRGKTLSALHLTELSSWDDATQIDGALMPAVPLSSRTIWLNESTAKGRRNWWHDQWLATKRGHGRFANVFIPWYAEKTKYWKPPPVDWVPSATTTTHAEKCRATSHQWVKQTVTLSREQLFWYETTRAAFEAKDDLATFLEEYCSDDEECFQHSGKSIFSLALQQRIADGARPLLRVFEVKPKRDLVQHA